MHQKIIASIFLLLPLFSTTAAEYKKGEDYLEIQGSLTAKKEVTEFFSFYCPACFKQEPFMNELKASLPADAVFKKNHVDSMPGRKQEVEHWLTKALITAKKLKVDDKIIPAIFNYIHVSKANFSDVNDVKNLFVINGVEADKFEKAFASFSVNMQAKKMQKNTQHIRNQGFSAVPTLIINGKYKPITKNIKTIDDYKKLVLFLLNKPV